MKKILALSLLLYGCATTWPVPPAFIQQDIKTTDFEIRTYQKNHSMTQPVHIYIEGDGHAFNARGTPTHNPTPRNTFLRDLAISDIHQNVAYIARPCQYNMSDRCTQSDWTDGRFSQKIIDNMSQTIKQIAQNPPNYTDWVFRWRTVIWPDNTTKPRYKCSRMDYNCRGLESQ